MFKLMKYEFRKQLFSKFFILAVIGILELVFLYGLIADKVRVVGTSIGLMIFGALIAIMYVSFECILTFSNDLKTKQSYMLFLTPNSTYKIVGAKVLTAFVQIGLTAAAVIAVAFLNLGAVFVKYQNVGDFVKVVRETIKIFFDSDIDLMFIVIAIVYYLLSWICTVITGMLAITLSATFLSNTKFKAIVSLIFFFFLNWLVSYLSTFISTSGMTLQDSYVVESIYMLGITGVFYFATAWMLDKKVSV